MPDHWRAVTLGEVADIEMGQSPPGTTYNDQGDGLPFLQGSAEFGNHYPMPDRWCSEPKKVAVAGDLLVSVRAPVGDTNFAQSKIAFGRGLARVRSTDDAAADYLRLVIQAEVSRLNQSAGSGMFASITAKNLRGFPVDVPPVEEQRRIVDVVGSVDAHIDALEAQIAATQLGRGGVLAELLGSPGADWQATTLGEVADVVSGGTPRTKVPEYWSGDIVWVTPTEIVAQEGGTIVDSERKITQQGLEQSSAKMLPVGAVLLTSRATIGAVALAGVPLATNQGFASLVCGEQLLPRFAMYWCQANTHELLSRAGGNTFLEVSRKKVAAIPIVLPPVEEQGRIVEVVGSMDEQIAALEAQAEAVRTVRAGVLAELLSGERLLDESYDLAVGL